MMNSPMFLSAMSAYDDGDDEAAAKLMIGAAQANEVSACFTLATWYHKGECVPIDLPESMRWSERYVQLAELGNAVDHWNLAQNYRFGNLVREDIHQANRWLERAAAEGSGDAQHHLAWYLKTGQYDYSVDQETSEVWYQRAFEQGHPETLYTFALREFRGGKITERAIALLREAAVKGFKQAEHVLKEFTH